LSDEDKAEIARLYESGLSIHKLALRFNVTDNPARNALRQPGVKMRFASKELAKAAKQPGSPPFASGS
jgi:transposase-like protein